MDQCAVFVDAGYLFGAATALLTNSHARRTLRNDQAAMVAALRELAESETGLPLLRIYWYDAARNRNPEPEQRSLALQADLKLRLGNLRQREDGRFTQKGVDTDLHADMTALARNGGASSFVLVSGDEDLLRAVEEVQGHGVRMHLWGVAAPAGKFNQSLELSAAADRRLNLDEDFLRRFFEIAPDSAEVRAAIETVAAASHDADEPAGGSGEDEAPEAVEFVASPGDASAEPAPEPRPTAPSPADLAPIVERSHAAHVDEAATAAGAPARQYLTLSQLTTSSERDRDADEDAARTGDTAADVGRTYGSRWRLRATRFTVDEVARMTSIPRSIDGDLLGYAARRGVDTWGDDAAKLAVRDGFWSALRDAT